MAHGEELSHPYFPSDMELPGFVPIHLPMTTIVGVYLLGSLLAVFVVWIASGRIRKISNLDRVLMCWWIFTGLTHIVLEGYFVFSPEFYKDKTHFYLAELWKEYSKGDSRYAARDSGIVSCEGITAVLAGPACLLSLYAIATKKSYKYLLQLIISVCQLYGTLVYFLMAVLDGDNFASGSFYYFWYYVFANSFWVLVPIIITVYCWKNIDAAIRATQDHNLKSKVR